MSPIRERDPDALIAREERDAALSTGKELVLQIRRRGESRPGPLYVTVLGRSNLGELHVRPWGCRGSFWIHVSAILGATVASGFTLSALGTIKERQRKRREDEYP